MLVAASSLPNSVLRVYSEVYWFPDARGRHALKYGKECIVLRLFVCCLYVECTDSLTCSAVCYICLVYQLFTDLSQGLQSHISNFPTGFLGLGETSLVSTQT